MKYWKNLWLFAVGGTVYTDLELLWRGRSHISMFLLSGGCFLALGKLSRCRLPRLWRVVAATAMITAGELLTGLLVNRSYRVWDYRHMPFNYLGQICLPYCLLWLPLSWAAMTVYPKLDRSIPR